MSSSEDHIPPADAMNPARRTATHRTRTGAGRLGSCAAASLLVVTIIFMVRNTGAVEAGLLGWQGSTPLVLALLSAGVGAAILTVMTGPARVTPPRRRNGDR
ncbi:MULTISPECIES: LapA family protein [Catenuloplanes]|uniref:Integral membrane protein n=1 Tax=Catenuloplanes niger TaxID=587534 RepID=A0AAE4CTX1_9ACTN|nr:hypothetical protein [Catenuloplanes niger]MDR7321149.1 putative integral membrane protein [Catenuloplanes niger]